MDFTTKVEYMAALEVAKEGICVKKFVINCWTCQSIFGGYKLMMACIFSGLPSIPLSEMR
jgi:hypothetical protein